MRHKPSSSHATAMPRREETLGPRAFHFASDRFLLFPIGAIVALIWANTAAESYFVFSNRFSFVVNEGGMALFFGLVAQEIVEAMMPGGLLHTWRRWAMPAVAATGGALGAAVVYLEYVRWSYEVVLSPAWPVTCAVDVTVAYYVVRTILPRSGALPFVLLLSIATDVFGLIVIAPRHMVLHTPGGGTALIVTAIGLAALLRSWKVRTFLPYLALCGSISWWAFYREGLHPALALVPIVPFLPHEPRKLNPFAEPPDDDAVHHAEHEWNYLAQVVLFLFGLVNAGVVIRGYDTGTWALLAAEFVGRPVGILAAVALGTLAGLRLPARVGWRELVVIALATSSGFTFALFFASGTLPIGPVLSEIKIGTLSTVAGAVLAVGAAWVLRVGRFKP
jgi:NhaA family Na+:H+ antiporter